jgi:hypothetical protein
MLVQTTRDLIRYFWTKSELRIAQGQLFPILFD